MLFERITPESISRLMISLVWIYQGFAPKLIQVAPLEKHMMSLLGFNGEISFWLTKVAGVSEVIFGLVFWLMYKSKIVQGLNLLASAGLLVTVALFDFSILGNAFNPVTTNLPLLGFGLILWFGESDNLNSEHSDKSLSTDR